VSGRRSSARHYDPSKSAKVRIAAAGALNQRQQVMAR
jgi:hypothetical protein